MESTTNKDNLTKVELQDPPQDLQPQTSSCACWVSTHSYSLVVETPVWSFLFFFFAENERVNLDSGIIYHFIKIIVHVIAFDEVERKPYFVAWLCVVGFPV